MNQMLHNEYKILKKMAGMVGNQFIPYSVWLENRIIKKECIGFEEYWNQYGELHASFCNGNIKRFAREIWMSASENKDRASERHATKGLAAPATSAVGPNALP